MKTQNIRTVRNALSAYINEAVPGRCAQCGARAALGGDRGDICEKGHIRLPNGDTSPATGHAFPAALVGEVWRAAEEEAQEREEREELHNWHAAQDAENQSMYH